MNNAISALLAIVGGVLTLAIVSVLVSPKAKTSTVIKSGGNALSDVINAAVAPVTGTTSNASGGGLTLASFAPGISSYFGGLI